MKTPRSLVILLLVLNAIVLLGMLWPEGAPPFARIVNIVTIAGTIVLLLSWLTAGRRTSDRASR